MGVIPDRYTLYLHYSIIINLTKLFQTMKKSLLLGAVLVAGIGMAQADKVPMRIYLQDAPIYPAAPAGTQVVQYTSGDLDDPIAIHYYIWENTYAGGTAATSEYGEVSELTIGTVGWWGGGFNAPSFYKMVNGQPVIENGALVESGAKAIDFTKVDDTWRIHFAFRTDIRSAVVQFNVGPVTPYNDANGNKAMPSLIFNSDTSTDKSFNGITWNVVDLPITELTDQYKLGSDADNMAAFAKIVNLTSDENYLTFNGGGNAGAKLAIADFYLYGEVEGEAALEDVMADAEVVGVEFFNIQGQKLSVEPDNGLFIKKEMLSNGTVKVTKIVK